MWNIPNPLKNEREYNRRADVVTDHKRIEMLVRSPSCGSSISKMMKILLLLIGVSALIVLDKLAKAEELGQKRSNFWGLYPKGDYPLAKRSY